MPDLLHTVVTVHHLSDDKRIRAHPRARKGLEVRHVLPPRQRRNRANLVPYLQEHGHRSRRFPQGILIPTCHYLLLPRTITLTRHVQVLWVFSEILESVCVIPQLLLLRQTTVPTVIDSFYLVTLGTYRAMYVLNWIVRGVNEDLYRDPTSWVWGSIQTALMIDFAWVYWTRQRVKLRHGGVVDSDDLGRGWLVGRFVGRKSMDFDYDEETGGQRNGDATVQPKNKWGRRGISVSADEGVEGAPKRSSPERGNVDPESQPLADPEAFEDESDDDAPPPAATVAEQSGVRRDEWDDDLDEDAREHDGASKAPK
jgi:ER lumen protein retaining receptor